MTSYRAPFSSVIAKYWTNYQQRYASRQCSNVVLGNFREYMILVLIESSYAISITE